MKRPPSKLRKGQLVEVFKDPITRKCSEGKARLVEDTQIRNGPLEFWWITFVDDEYYRDTPLARWINPDDAK
jgi:hypothetical protein